MLKILRKVYASPIAGLRELSTDEQTRLSWAKSIASYTAVPKAYKDFFEPFIKAGREFPYTVLSPSYEGFIHRTTEKLICDCGYEINVLEKSRNSITTLCFPLEGINYVEVKAILLEAHLKISGVTKEGQSAYSRIKFNTVTDYLFTPIVEKIRLASFGAKVEVQSSELEKFDYLLKVNYKFMNYARRSLLGDEKVIHVILQPEIRSRWLTVLGKTFYRTLSPTLMCILTNRELILIHEEAIHSGSDRYGGIWDYIPLKQIAKLSLSETDRGLLALSIHLPENEHLELLFQASAQPELDQLLKRFSDLTAIS
jgi:hypothetical protein